MYLAPIPMWLVIYCRAGARSIKLTVVSSQFPVPHLRTLPRQTYSRSLLRTTRGSNIQTLVDNRWDGLDLCSKLLLDTVKVESIIISDQVDGET